MRILLIEDEVAFQSILKKILTLQGYEIYASSDGVEGFETFNKTQDLDAVITDVNLPRLSGMDILEKIRAKTRDIPVICMTGQGDLELAQKAITLGAFALLLKPFPMDRLLEILRNIKRLRSKVLKPLQVLPWVTQDEFRLVIPSDPELIESTVELLQMRLAVIYKKYALTPFNIALALFEGLSNAMLHGNLEISSESKDAGTFEALLEERKQTAPWSERKVHIHLSIQQDAFVFEIEDEGSGFVPPEPVDLSDPMSFQALSGRGIMLMRMHLDEVEWNEKGNKLRLLKHLPVEPKK